MTIIKIEPYENGAHANQTSNMTVVPDGWAVVPPHLEAQARGFLPFIDLTVEDGKIVGVAQGAIPEPDTAPEPLPTEMEQLRADVDYLLMMQEG